MKLSQEQFSQTVAALGCVEGAIPDEHRTGVRVPMGTRATIIPCSEAGRREPATIVVLNLSETGVGILNNVPMRNGESFILRLPAVGARPPAAVLCTVVHSQSISMGMFAVGAQFTRVLAVNGERPAESRIEQTPSDVTDQDAAHVREVESRLSQLMQ